MAEQQVIVEQLGISKNTEDMVCEECGADLEWQDDHKSYTDTFSATCCGYAYLAEPVVYSFSRWKEE